MSRVGQGGRWRVLVTAGPTHEAIDPVRYLANRSSGRMGFALAEAAAVRGWEVDLVAGPVALATPAGVSRHDVVSAREMRDVVAGLIGGVDLAVMCAAVADFRPAAEVRHKVKKEQVAPGTDGRWMIELVRNPDILAEARTEMGFDGVLAGFAAETGEVGDEARSKLERKGCDFLVANRVDEPGIGFGAEENEVLVFRRGGAEPALIGRAPKREVAEALLDLFFGEMERRASR